MPLSLKNGGVYRKRDKIGVNYHHVCHLCSSYRILKQQKTFFRHLTYTQLDLSEIFICAYKLTTMIEFMNLTGSSADNILYESNNV